MSNAVVITNGIHTEHLDDDEGHYKEIGIQASIVNN